MKQIRLRPVVSTTLIVVTAALLLSACSSPPLRFYSLATPTPATASNATSVTAPVRGATVFIDVTPVGVPERLNRPQLVVQRGSGGRVDVLEQDRWASSFNNELQDTLSNDIAAELGAVDVKHGGRQAGQPVYRISVNVRQFDAIGGERVDAAFGWTVTSTDDLRSATCQATYSVPVGLGGTDALVSAIQKTVAMAGTAISATVNDVRASSVGSAVSCRS